MNETRLQQPRVMINCTFVTCFIVNCGMIFLKTWAAGNFARYDLLVIFVTLSRKNSRSLWLAPFLAHCRSLSLSLRGLVLGTSRRSRHSKDVPIVSEFWWWTYGLGAISPRKGQNSRTYFTLQCHAPGGSSLQAYIAVCPTGILQPV